MLAKQCQSGAEGVVEARRELPQEKLDDLGLAGADPFPAEVDGQVVEAFVERAADAHCEVGVRLLGCGGGSAVHRELRGIGAGSAGRCWRARPWGCRSASWSRPGGRG